mgnify:CR=1 FL=1|jgi:hypothetical protein
MKRSKRGKTSFKPHRCVIPLLDKIKTFSLLRNSGRPSAHTGTGMDSSGQSPSTKVLAVVEVFDDDAFFGGRASATAAPAAEEEEEEEECFFLFALAAATSTDASSCLRLVISRARPLTSLAWREEKMGGAEKERGDDTECVEQRKTNASE